MGLDFENSRSQASYSEIAAVIDVEEQRPMDLFKAFYLVQNNNELSSKQTQIMEKIFEKTGGSDI